MRFSKLVLSAVLTSALFAGVANAKTLYVSLSGNDANAGTLTSPYRTISKASRYALPGDVVQVRGGVYYESAGISSKGTSTARIRFESYPGEKAIFDGSNLTGSTAVFNVYMAEWVDVAGFEVRNGPYIGMSIYGSKNVRILNNHTHHHVRGGIYIGASSMGVSTNIVIDGNEVHDTVLENQNHTFTTGGWAGALAFSKTDGGRITNNKVYRNYGEAMGTGLSKNVVIEGNTISDAFSAYIYIESSGYITVNSNFLYNTGDTRFYRNGQPGAGIGVANETWGISFPESASNLKVTNNIVVGTRWGFYYGSFDTGGGLKNSLIANNTFYRATDSVFALELDAHAGNTVVNNIFHQVGAVMTKVAGGGVTYKNNLWYGGTPQTVATSTGDLYGDPQFVNPGGLRAIDYKVKAISPAVHTAAPISMPQTDFFGATRTTAFDIGAHEESVELGSGAPAVVPPVAPSNLRATATNGTTVSLTWTASADAASYKVYRDNAFVANVTGTSYTDAGRTAGAQYRYEVYAYDVIGNPSAASNAATVTMPAANVADIVKPTMPANLKTGNVTATSIAISWTASTDNVGVAGYQIYQNGSYVTTVTRNSYTASNLSSNTSYSFMVVAVDAANNRSAASNTATAKTSNASSTKRRSANR